MSKVVKTIQHLENKLRRRIRPLGVSIPLVNSDNRQHRIVTVPFVRRIMYRSLVGMGLLANGTEDEE